MRSKFKFIPFQNKELYKVNKYDNWVFKNCSCPVIPLLKTVTHNTTITTYNGNVYKKLKTMKVTPHLLRENFFFVKGLKIGSFRFSKKHCIFKARKKK